MGEASYLFIILTLYIILKQAPSVGWLVGLYGVVRWFRNRRAGGGDWMRVMSGPPHDPAIGMSRIPGRGGGGGGRRPPRGKVRWEVPSPGAGVSVGGEVAPMRCVNKGQYTCVCVWGGGCVHVCVRAYGYVCVYVCMYVCMYVCICIHVYNYVGP